MRAVVKGISNDTFDVQAYSPEVPDNFSLSLRVRIGPDGAQGADDFEISICTPKWLDDALCEARWGRGLLIVRKYDFSAINDLIVDYVRRCEGDNWESIVIQLTKMFFWEFDDYKE